MKIEIPIFIDEIVQLDDSGDTVSIQQELGGDEEESPEFNGCHIFVDVNFGNDENASMVVDTGASKTVVDSNLLAEYLEPIELPSELLSAGVNSNIDIQLGKLKEFTVAGFTINDYLVGLTDLSHVNDLYEKMGRTKIWGLLGGDFLLKYKAVIDYPNKKIIIDSGE